MGLLNWLFGKHSPAPDTAEVSAEETNPEYEQELTKKFSLRRNAAGWFCDGPVVSDFVALLSDPDNCWQVLKKAQTMRRFDHVCIVLGSPVVLVCNTTPEPVCYVSGLDAEGVAELVSIVMGASETKVRTYRGTLVLSLPKTPP